MSQSSLAKFFDGAAGKLLTGVEAHPNRSNQHEFNGVSGLKDLLGEPPDGGRKYSVKYVYLEDDTEAAVADSILTWYDARAKHPTRSECRLYYPPNDVMDAAVAGDYMVLARPVHADVGAELVVVVAPGRSTTAAQLQHLFDLEPSDRLDIQPLTGDEELGFASRQLLESLGLEVVPLQEAFLEQLLERFGEVFPKTFEFSAYCRATLPDVDGMDDPDAALVAWMDQEESLYRTFEHHLVGTQFTEAEGDVDRLLEIAMGTFQRRRSRAGHALENHVAELFDLHRVRYAQQAVTEGRKKPDFLFPGRREYLDPGYPRSQLRMLGVKTTCKDRWRQVLTEADLIPRKHLLTLEAPISGAQLIEMAARDLALVVPRSLHHAFGPAEKSSLHSVRDFIDEVLLLQSSQANVR